MEFIKNIRESKYVISSLILGLIFLFPIMRNAIQSILLMVFFGLSILFYYKTFLLRIKNISLWKTYGILTGFFWFTVLTFLWTYDKSFFCNEIRPTIAIAFIPFIIIFFHPPLKEKSRQLAIVFFLISLIIYVSIWFFHHIEGISIYQEIIAKESPIRDESIIDQILYLKNKSYKDYVGGLSDRGYELLGKNTLFSHVNYISSYFLFGFVLSVYMLTKAEKKAYKLIAIITLGLCILFLFYLSSKVNVFLFVIIFFIMICYFLTSLKLRILFLMMLLGIGLLNITRITEKINELENWDLVEMENKNLDDKIFLDYKRTKIYTCVIKELRNKYLFGIGLGDAQGYLNECLVEYNLDDLTTKTPKEYNSHSQFLHFALVGGVVNFFLFFIFFIYLVILSYNQKNSLLFIFTLIIFANCLFENYLSRIYGVLFFTLFLMMLPNWKLNKLSTAIKT